MVTKVKVQADALHVGKLNLKLDHVAGCNSDGREDDS